MNEQDYSQLISLYQEAQNRINYIETQFTPMGLTEHFVTANIGNTGEIWQSIFLLADEVKLVMELYNNAESGFFLSLSDAKKEELFTSLVINANSHLALYARLQSAIPDKMTNSDFPGIEESLALLNRIKDFNEWGQSIILDICSKYNPPDL